ncbi:MAG TPA: ABC transporter transmembrane domain-containing protein, partial [Planctomycetota bacterium]|nr:ABC transporter transmembrane domain-containing protein [Planctomycetota bacterium]
MRGRPALLRSLAVARRFLPQVAEHRGALIGVGLLSGATTALELAKPWPVQWIVDHALIRRGTVPDAARIVASGAAASLLIALLFAGLNFQREVRLAAVGHQVTRALRHRLFAHLASLSQRFHARHKSGDLLVRLMGDVPMLQGMLVESAVELATRTALVLGTLAIMLALDPLLGVTVVLALPLLALMIRLASRRIHAAVGKQRRKEGDMADFIHEAVAGTAVLQSLGCEADAVRRFARDNRTSTRAGLKASRLAAVLGFRVEA